ncbi:MAG: hypothetical protein VSS75_020990 [Candidatus Parabeggiatoa sp.]|nr:hypothetical protein [Candidatus Parabeggiatoa sp.]
MKSRNIMFISLVACVFQAQANDITGIWISKDYTCLGGTAPPTEKIKIEKKDSVFTAIKLVGDDCVPAGDLTFYWDTSTDNCQIQSSPAFSSEASLSPCRVKVVDNNNFELSVGSGIVKFSKPSLNLKVVTLRSALNSNKCLEGGQLTDCGGTEAQKWIWDGKRLLNVHNRSWKYYPYGTTDFNKWSVDGTALMKTPPQCLDGNTTSLPVKGCNGTDAQKWIRDWDDDALLRNFVIVYTGSDYTGTYSILGIGEYKIVYGHSGATNLLGIPEDSLTSLKVPKGLKVTLYKDNGFRGRSITVYKDTPSLESQNFTNLTSSIKIERK